MSDNGLVTFDQQHYNKKTTRICVDASNTSPGKSSIGLLGYTMCYKHKTYKFIYKDIYINIAKT